MRDLLVGASLAMHVLGYFAWRGAQRRNERLSVALQKRAPVPAPVALPAPVRPRLAERTMRDTSLWLRPVPVPEVVHTEEVELVEVAPSSPALASVRVTKPGWFRESWDRVNERLASWSGWPGSEPTWGGA